MTSPNKHPKSGVYYFRRGVPKGIRSVINKSEIKISLNTKNLTEAKRLIAPIMAEVEEEFYLAWKQINGEVSNLPELDMAIICDRWLKNQITEVEANDNYSDYVKHQGLIDPQSGYPTHSYETASSLLLLNEMTSEQLSNIFRKPLDEILKSSSLIIPFGSGAYNKFSKIFYSRYQRLEELCVRRLKQDWVYRPQLIANESLSTEKPERKPQTKGEDSACLLNLLVKYRESAMLQRSGAAGARQKTLDGVELQVKRFVEIFGDIHVGGIDRSMVAEFRDCLLQLPKSKDVNLRTLPMVKQIEIAKDKGLQVLSSATVNNALKLLSAFFGYALEQDLIKTNPRDGVKINREAKPASADIRKDYEDAEIQAIFSHSCFTDLQFKRTYGMACYWVPIILYYSGARVGEIAQLRNTDIVEREGVWVFSVKEGEGQSVKSASSVRLIPIHQHLIELGFLSFVKSNKEFLFDELPIDIYGKRISGFSDWFGKIVKGELGITGKQPFHAFRHTFKTLMRDLGTPEDVSDFITGHSARSVSRSYGGCSIERKQSYINNINRLALVRIL